MASVIPQEQIPLEMWITMITQQYPDLADELDEIAQCAELSTIEVEKKIYDTLQTHKMYLANGRIKPKAMCS